MAYREIAMWEVLEVLRRVARGEGRRAIARATGHGRATVDRYIQTANALGWTPDAGPADEALAREVVARLRPGPKHRPAGSAEAKLGPHRARLRAWLSPEEGSRGLQLAKVHELLQREGLEIAYASLHCYATKSCGFGAKPRVTVRMADSQPGEVAEVDFGRLGLVFDPETGKNRVHHALIVTLRYSRHQYVHICATQKFDDVIAGLERAWEFFGGVPARVVVDNMKTAVTKAGRYDPIFQRIFGEYADHRGFTLDATLPRHPTGKPTVERSVQYVRERFFRGESWINRDHVQREADRWCEQVAGQRIHGTTRQGPFEVFLETERPALRPLQGPAFATPTWGDCKVHPDHHIQFRKALYSVPTRHVAQTVTVRGDSKLVRIYGKQGDLIKTHAVIEAGHRSTDYDDYPAGSRRLCDARSRSDDPGGKTPGRPYRPFHDATARRRLPVGQAATGAEAAPTGQQVWKQPRRCRLSPGARLRPHQRTPRRRHRPQWIGPHADERYEIHEPMCGHAPSAT